MMKMKWRNSSCAFFNINTNVASAGSLAFVLLFYGGNNQFYIELWSVSGKSSEHSSLDGFFNIEEFMSALILL